MRAFPRNIKKPETRKGKIIFFSLLFLIAAALGGIFIYWQLNKKQLIRDKLESAIHKKSKGLYKISYDKLELDEVNGFLSITNMRVEYDSLKFASLAQQHMAPSSLFIVYIPEITIYGVKTPRALVNKEIAGRKLEIKNPALEIIFTAEGKDSSRYLPAKEVYEQILGDLNQIILDTVQLSGASVKTSNLKTKKQNISLQNVFVEMINTRVDSIANEDMTRILFSEKISLRCDSLSWSSDNNLYKYGADSAWLSSAAQAAEVKRFYVQPQLAEDAFVKSLPTQQDRFDFLIEDISIRRLDFLKLFDEDIKADSIAIAAASFKVYRDLSIPRDRKNRVGTYPQQAIKKLPVPVEIKKITVKNTFIEYKEKNAGTGRAGKVQFYHTLASIDNITNKKDRIADNNIMTVDIHSSFLNTSPIRTVWLFYLDDDHGRFGIKGNLGSMNAKTVNQLTESMGPARIEDGKIKSLQFDLAGNDYGMNGRVKFLYDDLKIAILEKDEDTKKLDKKHLESIVANLVMKNSNPPGKKDEPRIIQVQNERNTNRSIFHLAWKTLFKGIKETAGINK